MKLKRFTARTSREALALVRRAYGDDAVVVSTRPCAEGVEVLAMAAESVQQLERVGAPAPVAAGTAPLPAAASPAARGRSEPRGAALDGPVDADVATLEMSTLSFQDYVRQRMLRRRQQSLAAETGAPAAAAAPRAPATPATPAAAAPPAAGGIAAYGFDDALPPAPVAPRTAPPREVPVLREPLAPAAAAPIVAEFAPPRPEAGGQAQMLDELRSMRGLIEQRFGALAFMEKLQREPRQAQLTQKLLDCGFSPLLVRKLVEHLPVDIDAMVWAASVLERNLATGEKEPALEDQGGVYALVGPTGVGKTTSTAKLAAAFATRHGAAHLGLVTLDAYRIAAHEQLRTYGRILGVSVHTAHDRASLEDLLELLGGKKMVLIDTAGMAQRDTRTRELLEMLQHRSIQRLLVVNAAAQGETIDDVLQAYRGAECRGVVLSKLDEAVKLAPALDALLRQRLKVLAVANGQRVPEDWHRLSANALVQRALRGGGSAAWQLDGADVNLVFAAAPAVAAAPLRA